jgi:rhodanese-related sulfurtransferase
MHEPLRLAVLIAGILAASTASAFSITVRHNVAGYQDTAVPASGAVAPAAGSAATYADAAMQIASAIACVSSGDADCQKFAATDAVVVLEFTGGANTTFQSWSGCTSATGTACTVKLTSDRVVTASFVPATYEVRARTAPARTATWAPTYGGTVLYAAGGIACSSGVPGTDCGGAAPRGSPAVFTAEPMSGSRVKSWSGCVPAGPNATTCTLTAYAPTPVVVAFERDPSGAQAVVAQVYGAGTVTAGTSGQVDYLSCQVEGSLGNDCSASVAYGGGLVLTAIPPFGGKLAGWTGCTTASGLTCTLSDVTKASIVTAVFKSFTSTRLSAAVSVTSPSTAPGASAALTATATSSGTDPVTCAATLLSRPAGSAATLAAATPGDCRAGVPISFVPDVEGAYQVGVTPSDALGNGTSVVATVQVQWYRGGAVSLGTATPGAELTDIATRVRAVLSRGYNTISADVLMKDLLSSSAWGGLYGTAAAPAPGPFTIVDVRDPEDFAKGHIPGSLNVPLAQVPGVLLGNPALVNATAASHKVVVVGYNGGDANMASFLINVSRSDANGLVAKPSYALFGGITAWSYDKALSPTRFDDGLGAQRIENGAIETAAQAKVASSYTELGAFDPTVDTVQKKILVRAREFLRSLEAEAAANGIPHREAFWVTWPQYNALKGDGNPANDPQVVDVRSSAAYANHVPGSIFIAYQQVAGSYSGSWPTVTWGTVLDNTKYIDPARKVFVYCVTGHTGGIATMALGVLGYQVRNVLWAINGWSANATVVGTSLQGWDKGRGFDFPLHTWPNAPTTLYGWAPPRAGCEVCHTSHAAQFVELLPNPLTPPTATVVSEGEG